MRCGLPEMHVNTGRCSCFVGEIKSSAPLDGLKCVGDPVSGAQPLALNHLWNANTALHNPVQETVGNVSLLPLGSCPTNFTALAVQPIVS